MRVLFFVAVVCAFAECRTRPFDHPATDPSPSVDMAGAGGADLAQAPIDLSVGPDLAQPGCGAIIQCINNCGTDQTCGNQCLMSGSAPAQKRYLAAVDCGDNYCLGTNGAGPMRCAVDATGNMFVDAPGVPAGDCSRCLTDVFGALFGYPCDSTDAACNQALCKTPFEVCLNQ